jgi:hypothetical protein
MIPTPGNKKTSRDFQDRGWLVEGVVLFIRPSAHRFQTSPVRSPSKRSSGT